MIGGGKGGPLDGIPHGLLYGTPDLLVPGAVVNNPPPCIYGRAADTALVYLKIFHRDTWRGSVDHTTAPCGG